MGTKGLRRETIPVDFYFFFFPHSFHRGEWKIIEILKTDDPSFPNERLIESSPPPPPSPPPLLGSFPIFERGQINETIE